MPRVVDNHLSLGKFVQMPRQRLPKYVFPARERVVILIRRQCNTVNRAMRVGGQMMDDSVTDHSP